QYFLLHPSHVSYRSVLHLLHWHSVEADSFGAHVMQNEGRPVPSEKTTAKWPIQNWPLHRPHKSRTCTRQSQCEHGVVIAAPPGGPLIRSISNYAKNK